MVSCPVAIATARSLPLPDPDEQPLLQALAELGVTPAMVAWDEPNYPWEQHALVVIRSTWDYVARRDAYVAWAEHVARVTLLANPAHVVRWNTDKTYLRDRLQQAGLPIVPTLWLSRGADPLAAVAECQSLLFSDVVAKPSVSAGSFATERLRVGPSLQAFLQTHLPLRNMMVQPYQSRVDDEGERSHVFVAGEFSHAIRKAPRFAEGPLVVDRQPSPPDMLKLAQDCYAALGESLLYARIDLVRSEQGQPQIMEVELTEPYLMLDQVPEACTRFARAIAALLSENAAPQAHHSRK